MSRLVFWDKTVTSNCLGDRVWEMNDSAQPFYFVFTCFWMLVLISLQKHNSSPRLPTKLFCYISSYCSQCSPCYSFIDTKCIHLLSKFIPVLQLTQLQRRLCWDCFTMFTLRQSRRKLGSPAYQREWAYLCNPKTQPNYYSFRTLCKLPCRKPYILNKVIINLFLRLTGEKCYYFYLVSSKIRKIVFTKMIWVVSKWHKDLLPKIDWHVQLRYVHDFASQVIGYLKILLFPLVLTQLFYSNIIA